MKVKNKGVTFLETLISLGLLSIFSVLVFPMVKLSSDLNESLRQKSLIARNSIRILDVISKSITKAVPFKTEYKGQQYIKNGVGVIEDERLLVGMINESVLAKNSENGNILYLEILRSNGERLDEVLLIFEFLEDKLFVIEGRVINGIVRMFSSDILYEGIKGGFKKNKTGVIITYETKGKNLKSKEEIKGYENINLFY